VAITFEYVDSFDLEPDETEQGTTVKNRGKSCLLANFQERVAICVLHDPFSFWLESSRKVNLVVFLDQGYQFQHKLKFSFSKFLYLPGKFECIFQLNSHLLDWIHWHFCIT
jgi:hypothetical protein